MSDFTEGCTEDCEKRIKFLMGDNERLEAEVERLREQVEHLRKESAKMAVLRDGLAVDNADLRATLEQYQKAYEQSNADLEQALESNADLEQALGGE